MVLNMPLSFHKEAQMASLAAHCADEQGKFWEYRALLYMNQDKLKPEHLTQYALQIGLNAEAFNICINGNRYAELIQQDMKAAQMERITGTPTFVIGKSTSDVITGKRIVGAQAYRVFSNEIERLLQVSR